MRPLPEETLKSLRDYYRIGLTYTSNAIEGNSLTESETKVVIEDGLTIEGKPLRDVYEAVGHAHAYDYIHTLAATKPLEETDILELHRLFYEKIDNEKAGHYRTVPVFISGSQYAVSPPARIESDMKKFVKWFNDNEHRLPTPEFAALAHQKFVFIHPFIDGNGRVARLILNLALIRGEYTIALIPALLRHEYVMALEASHKTPNVFVDFIAERIIATQMDLLRLLTDGGVNGGVNDTVNGGVNLDELLFDAIKNNPGLNAPTIAEMLQKSLRTIQRHLKSLSDTKRIAFRGAPKNGGYYII
ncbi:Fic family protein [Prevotella sp. tc2-28]|uniref:Fic family protein n=1 Tax=Prevotella sp. tc2-28 TaxID=1761888 RepID=UPI002101349C|nr:Fic family protein [Prevotella sp. tc2-28]